MKTVIIISVIFVLTINNSLKAQSFDFRNANWSMDSLKVKKSETSKLVFSNRNSLIYKGDLGNWSAEIVYTFTESNQLYHANYLLNLDSKNPQEDINTFLILQESLSKKYKAPYNNIMKTINGKVITQDEWASNLISDNLNLLTKWKTDKTEIVLSLFSINDKLYIQIDYTSIEYEKKNREEKKKRLLEEL
jgi:hypothetical protein